MKHLTLLSAALCAFATAQAAPAMTQDEILQSQILSGWEMDNGHHMAAVQLTLAQGWKTYWRAPGEAGIPPLFDWSASTNVKSVRLHWPTPAVFQTNGMQTIGYHDGVVLPLDIEPLVPGQPVVLRGKMDLGICKDICMPASLDLSADLSAAGAVDPVIKAALKAQPMQPSQAQVGAVSCALDPIADGLRVTATIAVPSMGGAETVVFEPKDASIWVAQSEVTRSGNVLTAVTELVGSSGAPFALERSALRVTVLGAGKSVQIDGCPAP